MRINAFSLEIQFHKILRKGFQVPHDSDWILKGMWGQKEKKRCFSYDGRNQSFLKQRPGDITDIIRLQYLDAKRFQDVPEAIKYFCYCDLFEKKSVLHLTHGHMYRLVQS